MRAPVSRERGTIRRVKCLTWGTVVLLVLSALAAPGAVLACDTWVALPDATSDAITLFAKNSDRAVFDSGPLMFYPHQTWAAGTQIDLGRLSIPQVGETYATLGSSPYWCWGYEEGMNEFAVAIGNEGVWTRVLADDIAAYGEGRGPKPGLTGMDLVRLGLERGRSAREALEAMTKLLETHGQFGSGMPTAGVVAAYDNSYIIADPAEAWVLETAGTRWIAKRVSRGYASISNTLSITTQWDVASRDLMEHAVSRGWWPEDSLSVFDFAAAYCDDTGPNRDRKENALTRARRSYELLRNNAGRVDVPWMKRIARDRATTPGIDMDVTASSCVAVLSRPDDQVPVFWWCPTRPSNSCYVPFFVHSSGLPVVVSAAGTYGKTVVAPEEAEQDQFSPNSYWWLARDLCDKTNADWDSRNPVVRAEFDALEKTFAAGLTEVVMRATELRNQGNLDRAAAMLASYSARCVDQVAKKVRDLRDQFTVEVVEVADAFRPYVGQYVGNFGPFKDAAFKVMVQNGRLAVDIPGQALVELKDPDEQGLRHLVLTDAVAVGFDLDSTGTANTMKLYQTTDMQRAPAEADSLPEGAPDDLRPYLGTYTVPPGLASLKVIADGEALAVEIPNQGTIALEAPDGQGRRRFEVDPNASVSFERDGAGRVVAMKLHQMFVLPRQPAESQPE